MNKQIAELERKIERQQMLLAMSEEALAVADRPRERLRLQEEIEQIKALILGYQTQRARLNSGSAPEPARSSHETMFMH